jgi:hypothetical protein
MSPLIVEELDPLQAEEPPMGRFGRLDTDVSGQVMVHSDQPTVYHEAQRVNVGEASLEQSTFLWFYPSSQSGGEPSWRGFRMVLDQRGFAIVWEVLSSEARCGFCTFRNRSRTPLGASTATLCRSVGTLSSRASRNTRTW